MHFEKEKNFGYKFGYNLKLQPLLKKLIELHILKIYLLDCMFFIFLTHMLFTIWSISLFLCIILNYKNLKFKYLIDDICINLWSFENFVSMEDIKRKCKIIMNLSKFTSYKEILSRVVVLGGVWLMWCTLQ